MHKVKITRPLYEQSKRFAGEIGEVIGHWGPENSKDGKDGYLVQFANGEVVGIAMEETEDVS